jgi:hypothetical protein
MAQASNPSYSGNRDQDDHGLRLPQAKSNENPKAGMMTHTCNPSYIEGIGRSMVVHRQPWVKIVRPYLKNNPKRQKRTRILLKW